MLAEVVYRAVGVKHRRVVFSAAAIRCWPGTPSSFLGEVHGNLAGLNDFALAGLAFEELMGKSKQSHTTFTVDADLAAVFLTTHQSCQQSKVIAGDSNPPAPREKSTRLQAHHRRDAVGEVLDDFTRQLDAVVYIPFPRWPYAFQRGDLEVGTESPFEA